MKKIVKRFRFFGYDIIFVMRNRFEPVSEDLPHWRWRKEYRLGVWYKLDKLVGKKNFNNPSEWENNIVNDYKFGIDLILVEMWISISKGAMLST